MPTIKTARPAGEASIQPAARVLAFDPVNRRSSRRVSEPTLDQLYDEAAFKAEALALGLIHADLDADPDFYYNAHTVRPIEAAFAKSAAEGRAALVAALFRYYGDGYDCGLADGAMRDRQRPPVGDAAWRLSPTM